MTIEARVEQLRDQEQQSGLESKLLSVRVMDNLRRMKPDEYEYMKKVFFNSKGEIVVERNDERLDRLEERVKALEKCADMFLLPASEPAPEPLMKLLYDEWKKQEDASLQNENPEGSENA